ncbi:MAG: hypothetical protein JSU63_14900 [Phycisphaerales bacterium]|nr:MAG: hypothetical protein JSU63_14900 [Phycisphaerales bacterium]
MSQEERATSYRALIKKTTPPPPQDKSVEGDLDTLLAHLLEREGESAEGAKPDKADPVETLRELTRTELVTVFIELKEKYAKSGIFMEMDASSFLSGGREIKFEMGLGEYRANLHGTVTSEAIAFHETRHSPDMHGELVSGPMLRLRGLDATMFREFICERLTLLLRTIARARASQTQ